jgi:thymidylate synthase (FAD)
MKMDMIKGTKIEIKPFGYVRYVDHLGSDRRIVEAARVSYHSPSKGDEADYKLLEYLYRNRHTSPFEQCNITFNIKFPIFLMRQFVRHRMFRLNEWSGRYSELADEFYTPEKWRAQDTKNKQGSVDGDGLKQWQCDTLCRDAYRAAYESYQALLKQGVAKEQARFVLPVGIYTEIYVNCDLHNLLHFLRLRLDAHAQAEMREIAEAMRGIAAELFPWTFAAFEKFVVEVREK